jgi:hypothetical protein
MVVNTQDILDLKFSTLIVTDNHVRPGIRILSTPNIIDRNDVFVLSGVLAQA